VSSDDNSLPDLVLGDAGGWISGPSLDVDRTRRRRWACNLHEECEVVCG